MWKVMWKSMCVKWDYLFTYSRPEKHLSSMQCPLHKFLDSVFRIQNARTFRNWAELLLPTCPHDGNADAMQNINLIWNAKFSLKLNFEKKWCFQCAEHFNPSSHIPLWKESIEIKVTCIKYSWCFWTSLYVLCLHFLSIIIISKQGSRHFYETTFRSSRSPKTTNQLETNPLPDLVECLPRYNLL